jgi:eukaryotic-like serine/threonine-protein kinase
VFRKTSQISASDATIDAPPSDASSPWCARFQRVGFIEGSRPQISTETTHLLRTRLRAAAGFLGLAFGLFFVYRLITGDGPGGSNDFTFYFHFANTVVLVSSFALLCRRCNIPLSVLRGYELAIFGLPVAYFLIYDYRLLGILARRNTLPNPLAFWMGIVFIYALFIPNTWRRAVVVIGAICAAPLLLLAYLWATDPVFASVAGDGAGFWVEITIMLGITFLSSTYGTHMIGSLRREAFEARQLGQYRLCRLIGSGGMGDVYLAEHQMMKRPCAIKLIRPGKAHDPQALARFEREVRATAKLSHWNTIEIFDYGRTEDGTFYYVMEYLPGLSLAELVEKHGPLPAPRAIHLLSQSCDALGEAHAAGLIHRDIKPGNIFAAQRGGIHDVAKLLDFGLAKPIATSAPVQLTQEGSITGSPLFMSPEQALGDSEPDARSDIYSLGAVAYYLLTGVPPFDGDRAIKIILAHAQQPVLPPSRLRSDIPRDVEQIVLRCLAKNPADRYQSAAALRQALSECVAAGGWTPEDAAGWWQTHSVQDSHLEALAAAAI